LEQIEEGMIVSYKCASVSSLGVPQNPSIIRIRPDMDWTDVVDNYEMPTPKSLEGINISFSSLRVIHYFLEIFDRSKQLTKSPDSRLKVAHGYWTNEDGKNARKFLDEFARVRSLDPLNPSDWYSVKKQDVVEAGVLIII
jgi:hypothetical protein